MYPGMGYPGQPGQPMYPQGVVPPPSGYPGSVPGGYPPQSGAGYPPQAGYPAQGGYPPQPQYPQSGGYPGQQPGYPSQPGYPPSQPGYPASQAGYPSSQPGYPQAQPGYPQAQQGYPPQGYPGVYYNPAEQRPAYPYPPGYQHSGNMPQAQQGYPPQQGYAPQPGYQGHDAQPSYPSSQQPSYPAQPNYSNAAPTAPPSQYQPQPQHQQPSQPSYQNTDYGKGEDFHSSHSPPRNTLSDSLSQMTILGGAELFHPTVKPVSPFSAEDDASCLRKAMKGMGTDEAAIIDVLSTRSNQQRQEIAIMFKTMYGKDIIEDLKSELSGHLEELIMALFKPPAYYDAWSIHKAIDGIGTKDSVLIEILCTRTNAEIHEIVDNYKTYFRRDLEKDIIADTSGYFKRLLVSCLQGNRNELTPEQAERVVSEGPASVIDLDQARNDAQRLYDAGVKKIGTDESEILSILAIRNYYQMKATFDEYARISGKDIIDAIKSECSGDLETGFKTLITCSRNRPEFFAKCLNNALSGMGTKDHTVIRVIVTRCEIDLYSIRTAYTNKYGKDLNHAVATDTSGDYKKLLLGLLGQ